MELKRIEDVLGCIVATNLGFGGLVTDIEGPNECGSYRLSCKVTPGRWGNGSLGAMLKDGSLVMDEPTALVLSGQSQTLIVKRSPARQKTLFEAIGGDVV